MGEVLRHGPNVRSQRCCRPVRLSDPVVYHEQSLLLLSAVLWLRLASRVQLRHCMFTSLPVLVLLQIQTLTLGI